MKAVLMSIRPKWAHKIDSGEKTVEVRKSFPLQLHTPFKVYLYCSKGKERLIEVIKDGADIYGETYHGKPVFITLPEGDYWNSRIYRKTVFGEFICDNAEHLQIRYAPFKPNKCKRYRTPTIGNACLSVEELEAYGKGSELYGWHISKYKFYGFGSFKHIEDFGLKRPPESWCYVEDIT